MPLTDIILWISAGLTTIAVGIVAAVAIADEMSSIKDDGAPVPNQGPAGTGEIV